jgi:5-methyltetrahydrofolate--homocysteine methyltransferase
MVNERARSLRKTMTGPERKLWRELSGRAAGGLRFRRQHPIGPYIADFVCLEKRLVVEVDGELHALDDQIEHDRRRTAWLESEGYRVIRFWSNEVMDNIGGVVEAIMHEAGVL